MPTNWPPATAPTWPPPELGTNWFSSGNIKGLVYELQALGFTLATPTSAENSAFFPTSVRCDHGDRVVGRILVSPSGVRYPFAICNAPAHRDLLVLWPPYYAGFGSGIE